MNEMDAFNFLYGDTARDMSPRRREKLKRYCQENHPMEYALAEMQGKV